MRYSIVLERKEISSDKDVASIQHSRANLSNK